MNKSNLFTITKDGEDPPSHMVLFDDPEPLPGSYSLTPTRGSYAGGIVPPTGSYAGGIVPPTGIQGLVSNCSSSPVFADSLAAEAAREITQTVFAPIQEGNKTSREISVDIFQGRFCFLQTMEDGRKILVGLFNGCVADAECVAFKNKQFFRLIFTVEGQTKSGKCHVLKDLDSVKKVGTILCEELTALEKRATDKNILSFIRMKLCTLISKKQDCCKSLHFGWSYSSAGIGYTRQLPGELFAFSKFNKDLFFIAGDTPTESDALIQNVINAYTQINDEKSASIFLVFSFVATLYSLIGLNSSDTVLVLLGSPYPCKRIASHFMKAYVRRNNEDAISLSEDNRNTLQDYLTLLHDDVAIITDDASSKYDREKLKDIYKYAESGECQGERIQTLFAICSNEPASLRYDKQLFIHVQDNTKINFQDTAPQTFRRFIIKKIEEKPGYWCKRISEICRTNQMKSGNGSDFMTAAKTACDVLSEILQSEDAGKDSMDNIRRFFNLGIDALEHQINGSESMDILSCFRNIVTDSVGDSSMKVWNRFEKLDAGTESIIFYDDVCYYFPAEVFTNICMSNAIGKDSQTSLKRSLAEAGALRTYRYLKSKPDIGYDFRYFNENGVNARASGLAIYRSFWDDEPGSISLAALYESVHKNLPK